MRYRTNLGISSDIFSVLKSSGREGVNISSILQKANLQYTRLSTILNHLVDVGLVLESQGKYRLTPSGLEYTRRLQEFSEFTDAFGLRVW